MIAVIIPAREGGERFPGKMLKDTTGKPLIRHTVDAAMSFKKVWESAMGEPVVVHVATDSYRLASAVTDACPATVVCQPCWCGTDRAGVVVGMHKETLGTARLFVNWQGDEPLLTPQNVAEGVIHFDTEPSGIATLVASLESTDHSNINQVKAYVRAGQIRRFSRHMVPPGPGEIAMLHVGCYFFRPSEFWRCTRLSQTPAAERYRLEQIAWTEDSGIPIAAVPMPHAPISVNTPEDYEEFRQHMSERTI